MEIKTLRHAGVQMSAGKLYGKLEEDADCMLLIYIESRDYDKKQVVSLILTMSQLKIEFYSENTYFYVFKMKI